MPLVTELFAFLVDTSNGEPGEYVPMFVFGDKQDRTAMPLIGADIERVNALREVVISDPAYAGRRVRLVRYTRAEDVAVVDRTHER